jgi:hypothetical protein
MVERFLATGGLPLARRHALVGKLFNRFCVLRQMRESHAAQYVRRLTELDIIVGDDLDAVAPRVEEIEKPARQRLNAQIGQRLANRFLVIDHKSKMTAIVSGLCAALLERKELVA